MRSRVRTKACRTCGQVKPFREFYKHPQTRDGRLSDCKACVRAKARDRREVSPEHVRKLERDRYARSEKRRGQVRASTERQKAEDPEGYRKRHRKAVRRHVDKYPGRRKARTAVGNALRDGRLVKGPCEGCGEAEGVQAHHDDYSRPLDVRWLCRSCHGVEHRV